MDALLRSKIEATKKSVFRFPAHEELRSRLVGAVSDKLTHMDLFGIISPVQCGNRVTESRPGLPKLDMTGSGVVKYFYVREILTPRTLVKASREIVT